MEEQHGEVKQVLILGAEILGFLNVYLLIPSFYQINTECP